MLHFLIIQNTHETSNAHTSLEEKQTRFLEKTFELRLKEVGAMIVGEDNLRIKK